MNLNSPFRSPFSSGATSALSSPLVGGIGYANRLSPLSAPGDWWDFLSPVVDTAEDLARQAAQDLLKTGVLSAKKAAGYQDLGVVQVDGKVYIKMKKSDGTFVLVDDRGLDRPFTSVESAKAQSVDPNTGMVKTVAITGAVIAGVALIAWLALRKK